MTLPRVDFVIRVVSILLALALGVALPLIPFVIVGIVLGQGHFFLSYIYQIEGKHMSMRKLTILVALFAGMWWLASVISLDVLVVLVGLGFMVHFTMDEIRLLSGKHSLYSTLEGLPLVLVYSAMISDAFLHSMFFPYACAASVLILAVYAFLALRAHRRPNALSYLLFGYLAVSLVLYGAAHVFAPTKQIQWFVGLGLVHYFIWYGYYWFKLKARPAALTIYTVRVLVLNLVLVIGVLFWLHSSAALLALFFSPTAFEVWIAMHGFATFRLRDYGAAVRLS